MGGEEGCRKGERERGREDDWNEEGGETQLYIIIKKPQRKKKEATSKFGKGWQ